MNQSGTVFMKATLLISAIMQILSSLWQIGGLDARYIFFSSLPSSERRCIAHPEYVSLGVRIYFNDVATNKCNLQLFALQRGSSTAIADRCGQYLPTRIIVKSRTQAAPARPSAALHARAAFIEHYLFPSSSSFGEHSRDIAARHASITIERSVYET